MKRCHKCGLEWTADKPRPGFKETCAQCSAYLHSCKNCRFYNPSRHNACEIPTTEFVPDRHKFNFCDDFQFADSEVSGSSAKKNPAKTSFDALFDGKLKTNQEKGPTDFDKLFDK